MKVDLAAQTLSASVANALQHCRLHLKIKEFKDSEATEKYIRVIDRLFDIMNSRNPLGKGFKAPLKTCNKTVWEPFLNEAFDYLLHLKMRNGTLLYKSKHKTAFIGFMLAIETFKQMFYELVEKDNSPLNYILTYKCSQDHLELLFCAIRGSGGFNNNPTIVQFIAIYKRLLLRSHIGGSKGNCTPQVYF